MATASLSEIERRILTTIQPKTVPAPRIRTPIPTLSPISNYCVQHDLRPSYDDKSSGEPLVAPCLPGSPSDCDRSVVRVFDRPSSHNAICDDLALGVRNNCQRSRKSVVQTHNYPVVA